MCGDGAVTCSARICKRHVAVDVKGETGNMLSVRAITAQNGRRLRIDRPVSNGNKLFCEGKLEPIRASARYDCGLAQVLLSLWASSTPA